MGQSRRRAAGTRSRRAQLGLVTVTLATALMMGWAILPGTAFASTEVTPWTGNGAPKLPCPGTTHWIFSGWGNDFDEVSNPVLTVNGTNYPMSQQGNGNVFEAFVPGPLAENPSASASWTWDETSDKPTPILTISDCDTDPTTPPPTTTTPPPTTTTPPPTTTTPPPTTTTPPPTTTTPPPKGRIEIKKETIPDGDPTRFTFTGAFNITIGDGQGAANNVDPGTYTVSESVPAGWTLTSIVCDDDDSFGSGTTATYIVDPGETVKCVFTNTKNPPTTTTPPPTTTTPPATTTTPPPTTSTPPPTTTTAPPTTTEPPTTSTEPPRTTTEPPTVSPTTIEPSEDTTTQPPGGTAFTGVQNVVPLGAIALILLTTGSGLMWAGSRRSRTEGDQD
jgi:hypothetical protein